MYAYEIIHHSKNVDRTTDQLTKLMLALLLGVLPIVHVNTNSTHTT